LIPEHAAGEAAKIAAQIFEPRKWDKPLKATIAPGLVKAVVTGVASETALKLYAVARKHLRRLGEAKAAGVKATSASEYIADMEEDLGADLSDIPTEYPPWMIQATHQRLTETFAKPYWQEVNDATRNGIETMLKNGIEQGLSTREIAKQIGELAPERAGWRATNCARTECGNMLNYGAVLGIKQTEEETGMPATKVWMSIHGTYTRETHAEADGQEIPVDDLFVVGGESARWPGDENLSAGERCNCMCTLLSGLVYEELGPEVEDEPEAEEVIDSEALLPGEMDLPEPEPMPEPLAEQPQPVQEPPPQPESGVVQPQTDSVPAVNSQEYEDRYKVRIGASNGANSSSQNAIGEQYGREVNQMSRFEGIEKFEKNRRIRDIVYASGNKTTFESDAGYESGGTFVPQTREIKIAGGLKPGESPAPKMGGWLVTDGKHAGDAIRHEYGHKFWFTDENISPREFKKISEKYVGTALGKKKISKYGASSHEELFAESFAAYTHTRYKPGTLPKDIEDYMVKYVGKPRS
jgi:hypothetical protein